MAIHVLHVIPSLGRGGAERQLVGLANGTNHDRFKHTVCYLRPPDDYVAALQEAGHEVISLGAPGTHPWGLAAARLIRILRVRRPDIVQSWLYDANIATRLAHCAGPGAPLVTSLQCCDYDPETIRAAHLSAWKVGGLRWLDRLSARLTRPLFVACSDCVRQSARRHLRVPVSRIRVIYNSVDPSSLAGGAQERLEIRRSLSIPEDAFVYLNVGRLDPQKGQAHLLEAFARISRHASLSYLVIVGEGPLRTDLQRLADQLEIGDRVRLPGLRRDVGAFLRSADVFVFPSFFEGLPLALVEAMLSGMPCIASRIGPHQEVIRDGQNGLLTTPGVVNELAAAMERLYHEAAFRRRLAAQARGEAALRFRNDVVVPQWEALYCHLVQPGVGRRAAPWAGRRTAN